MSIFRRTGAPPMREPQPAPLPVDILAGAAAVGLTGGSGMVPAFRALANPDDGGRVDFLGQDVVQPGGQLLADLTPDSLYVDRPLHGGGVRTSPHFGQFRDEPDNSGGYVVVTGRTRVQLGSITYAEDAPAEVVRLPIGQSACDVRAQAMGESADDLAAIARSGARQSLGYLS